MTFPNRKHCSSHHPKYSIAALKQRQICQFDHIELQAIITLVVFSYSSYSISCKVRNIPRIDGREVMAMPMLGDSTGGEGPGGRDLATGETRSLEGGILQPEKQGLWEWKSSQKVALSQQVLIFRLKAVKQQFGYLQLNIQKIQTEHQQVRQYHQSPLSIIATSLSYILTPA